MNDSSTNYWPMPAAFTSAPMRWVLTSDAHNCSGIPCPRDTFCMRPEPFAWPNYCVHKQAMHDVPELLAKGPAMIYCEDIGQAVLAAILAMILLVQLANLFVNYRRSKTMDAFYRNEFVSKNPMETELRPLAHHRDGGGHSNLTYEQSVCGSGVSGVSGYEPRSGASYMPFHQV